MDAFRLPTLGDYSQGSLVSPLIRLACAIAAMIMMSSIWVIAAHGARRHDSSGVEAARMTLNGVTLPTVTVVAHRESASAAQGRAMLTSTRTVDLGTCAFCACANQATISR